VRLFAMLELSAFSDESYTDHEVYCVAGYWAVAKEWERFDAEWNAELARLDMREFHSEECASGNGREELPKLFAGIVGRHFLHGMFAVIDLTEWDRYAEEIAYLRPLAKDRFYIPFEMYLEGMCADRELKGFAPDERVHLVFDHRQESGKIIMLYNWLRDSPDPAFKVAASRLGDATSGDSKRFPGLQAADLLAYEAREYVTNSDWATKRGPTRPAWLELWKRRPLPGRGIEPNAIPLLMERMRATLEPEARARKEFFAARRAERDARGADLARARRQPSSPRSPGPEPPEETS
jgi:hypothetical protein